MERDPMNTLSPDELKARMKKLSTQATQAKMDLHDLAEDLPVNWEHILEVAQRCHDAYAALIAARQADGQ
jgi:hypothetical protein